MSQTRPRAMADDDLASFARAHVRQLLGTARLLTGSRESAEDLVQETLLNAFRSWNRVQSAEDQLAYVHRIMINRMTSERRRGSWRIRAETLELDPEWSDEQDQYGAAETKLTVRSAVLRLPIRQRAVIVMAYYLDYSTEKMATALRVRESTVRSLKTKGLQSLEKILAAHDGTHR